MNDKLKDHLPWHVLGTLKMALSQIDCGAPPKETVKRAHDELAEALDSMRAILAEQAPQLSADALEELLLRAYKDCKHGVYHVCSECVHEEFDKLRAIERAPAGEWDARAAEKFLQRHYTVALAVGDTHEPERVHISGWLNLVSMAEELSELAAGRSSQLVEPRDPTAK